MGKALSLSYQQREEIARKLFQVRSVRGPELHGLCPYHEDSNPSFSYNVEKDVFNCLACGVGGDLIKLWSKAAGTGNLTDDFKAFCRQYGIALEGRGRRQDGDAPLKKKAPRSSGDKPVAPADLARAWEGMGTRKVQTMLWGEANGDEAF
ncbi:CHC2 zinc finger domain-containing protein [Desulfatitalea tepidiphila]|uniref:CHC2 zinc finger domain-containing protein n=1 Tax=Desulfatitalea tepidiphila TaxID=1185843 RepID=UPI0006B50A7A|nr:CHC2 zinc finger domain-containing protein [Desulfatitalea tepidiphila]